MTKKVRVKHAGESQVNPKMTLLLLLVCFFFYPGIPIKFSSHLKNVRVQERGKARLECEMSSRDVHIRWLKDGCDITASRRYIFMREGKRAEVIIEDCELTDEGKYSIICTQDNDEHQYVSSANLTVDGKDFCLSGVFFFFF